MVKVLNGAGTAMRCVHVEVDIGVGIGAVGVAVVVGVVVAISPGSSWFGKK